MRTESHAICDLQISNTVFSIDPRVVYGATSQRLREPFALVRPQRLRDGRARGPSVLSAVDRVPATPVARLALEEGADGAEVAFVAQEVCLLLAVGPEADGVRQGVHCLAVAADEGAAEVDVLEVVFAGLEVGDLADVVTVGFSLVRCRLNVSLEGTTNLTA